MKKIIISYLFIWIAMHSFSQDYFEKKIKEVKNLDLISLIIKGTGNFDFTRISDKTLIIPKYDPKSTYQDLVLNKQYDKLSSVEDKNKYYEETWKTGIQESSFNECPYKIIDINFEDLSKDEKKKYLFLSYHQVMGYYYALIWYVDKNYEELPAVMILINDLDLGYKNDLRFMFNILNQSILMNQEYSNKKMYADMQANLEDDSKPKIERFYSLQTQDAQDAINTYYSKLVANYLSEAEYMTLLLPEDKKNKALDKAMVNWTYSKYEYLPKEPIEEKRRKSDPNYCYLRLQTAGSGLVASTTAWILSTENDRILYQYLKPFSANDKLEKVMPKLIDDIEFKKERYDTESTITYETVEFISNELPTDLKDSKIAYVNLTKEQYTFGSWLNKSFERKMKKYPYQFKITDEIKDISDCKYRVRLKSFMQTYKKTTRYSDRPNDVDYVTKELFYLYLQNIETGECYKFQDEPDFYPNTFKAFVEIIN